jgi:hypothetical protein
VSIALTLNDMKPASIIPEWRFDAGRHLVLVHPLIAEKTNMAFEMIYNILGCLSSGYWPGGMREYLSSRCTKILVLQKTL